MQLLFNHLTFKERATDVNKEHGMRERLDSSSKRGRFAFWFWGLRSYFDKTLNMYKNPVSAYSGQENNAFLSKL